MKIKSVSQYFYSKVIILVLVVFTACDTTSSIPYKASTTNVVSIQKKLSPDTKISVSSVSYASGYKPDLLCRLLGELDVGNGKSIPEYIKSAFEEEIFLAGHLDTETDNGINVIVENVDFSTVSPARWEIDLHVSSGVDSGGYRVSSKSNFKTSFNAYSACQNASVAFGPAVQSALEKVISHPRFVDMF